MKELQHDENHTIPLLQLLSKQFGSDEEDAFDHYQNHVNHFVRLFSFHYFATRQEQQQVIIMTNTTTSHETMPPTTGRATLLHGIQRLFALFKTVEIQSDLFAFYLQVRVMLHYVPNNAQPDLFMVMHEQILALLAQVNLTLHLSWQKMKHLYKVQTMETKWYKIKGTIIMYSFIKYH